MVKSLLNVVCILFFISSLILFQEFSPGSNGRMTTMGLYVRDLLLGQVSY